MDHFATSYAQGDKDEAFRMFLRASRNEGYNQRVKNTMTDADGKKWQEFIDKMRQKQKQWEEKMGGSSAAD